MKRKKNLPFLKTLGPGLITGAADDDPSGIGTYTVAGAKFGTSLLWASFITWPLMTAVQMMCSRIGMVTGEGLATALKKKYSRAILLTIGISLLIANTLNVGADLAAMADAATLLTGWPSKIFLVFFTVVISWATVRLCYSQITSVLKWLAVFLFAYVFTAFLMKPDWPAVFRDTFVPNLPKGSAAALVALLGTTISPYLFFWQPAQEVEEEKAMGRRTVTQRRGATAQELRERKIDTGIGTLFSNIVMFFIILTAALTLHKNGVTDIETSSQAASALRPLAGDMATWLYAIGLIGTGLLAIPTLTGSAAYAFAEIFGWKEGLDAHLKQAKAFYGVIVGSAIIALLFDLCGFNPVKALFWSAVVNGVLAPFLLIGIVAVAGDAKLMRGQPSSLFSRAVVIITAIVMFASILLMFTDI